MVRPNVYYHNIISSYFVSTEKTKKLFTEYVLRGGGEGIGIITLEEFEYYIIKYRYLLSIRYRM